MRKSIKNVPIGIKSIDIITQNMVKYIRGDGNVEQR